MSISIYTYMSISIYTYIHLLTPPIGTHQDGILAAAAYIYIYIYLSIHLPI